MHVVALAQREGMHIPAELLESVPRNLIEERAKADSQPRRRLAAVAPRRRQCLRDRSPLGHIERVPQRGSGPTSRRGKSDGRSTARFGSPEVLRLEDLVI